MKPYIIATACTVLAGVALPGIPVGLGDVSVRIAATATYDSNVFGAPDTIDDYSGTLTPRVTYVRKAGLIEAEANAGISFIRYLELTELDADNIDIDASLWITKSDIRNYSGLLSAAYRETSDLDADINARINTTTAALTGEAEFATGPRTNLGLSGSYYDISRSEASDQQRLATEVLYTYSDFFHGNSLRLTGNYDQLQSSGGNDRGVPLDQTSYMAAVGLSRRLAQDALLGTISAGYRILHRSREETAGGVRRQAGYVISASLEGPFLPRKYFPKVESEFTLSYRDAANPGINDPGSKELTGSMLLSWQARHTTQVSFAAHRIQRLSVNDLSVVSTMVQLGVTQILRHNLTASVKAGYDWSSFRGIARNDKTASLHAALTYHFARAWDMSLTYIFNSTSSTLRAADYSRQVASLQIGYRF
jgi:hypothetical protein